MKTQFQTELSEHLEVLNASSALEQMIIEISDRLCEMFTAGGKLLLCGNGGSAADSQHLAAEFVVRFRRNRPGLAAIALTTDASSLTAAANDYDFTKVFSRQVEALGRPGDFLMAISTSGISPNVIEAATVAKNLGLLVIAITGDHENHLSRKADFHLRVPSESTARIQECYLFLGHMICELVENHFYKITHGIQNY